VSDRDIRKIMNSSAPSINSDGSVSRSIPEGSTNFVLSSNSQLAMFKKHKGRLWKTYLTKDGSQSVDTNLDVRGSGNINKILKVNGSLGIRTDRPEASLSITQGYHKIAVEQDIRFAHSSDNTVIVELPNVKIPAYAIITNVAAVVKTVSDLSTHDVSIQMSATSGTAADSSISSGTELLGRGVTNTDSSDSTSAQEIDLKNDLKEVWICRDTVRNGSSDQYIYIVNGGTSNGTTNSTTGTLLVFIDYYGMD
jgi:Tfp pilus assembly major pilin PilA